MQPLPTKDLRTNLGTWAVTQCLVPAVAHFMHDALPNESFDPHFLGQHLETTYFDTAKYELRKNRVSHDKYMTLRVRCYQNREGETYAVSAKTEESKFRVEVSPEKAHALLSGKDPLHVLAQLLPADLLSRLLDVSHEQPLLPVVTIYAQRYAIEDDQDRFTLDTDITTNLHKVMPYSVLEFKSAGKGQVPHALKLINLQPIKLSKFLWATRL